MAKIYQYQKVSDDFTEYRVQGEGVTELCTISGVTFISVAEELPTFDDRLNVAEAVLTAELRSSIKSESTHVQLINDRIKIRIAERYSIEDELKMLRLAPSEESTAYNTYAEECRDWGREQKTALGL